uniref:receptor protein-tyrosine kinase n=1 Tax=Tetranychus urticae TaxID=32264 RepID=T1KGM6_TETUR
MNIPLLILFIFIIFIHSIVNVLGYSKAPPRLALPKTKTNPVIYLVGSKVQLQCPVYADPKRLFVEWMRNDMPVEHIHRYFVTLNGYLRIEYAQLEDSGVYTCKAANGFGAVYANITLSILRQEDLGESGGFKFDNVNRLLLSNDYPEDLGSSSSLSQYNYVEDTLLGPYFVDLVPPKTKVIKLNSGKPLRLRCNVAGKPRPEILWYKNGSPISPTRLPPGTTRFNGIFTIPESRIEDSGYYMCVASNVKGQINTTFSVTISDKVNRPEIIGINPENSTVLLGQHTFLDCQFKSKLEPLVRWLKELSPEELEDEPDEGILIEIDGEYFRSLKSSPILHKRDGIYYNRLIIDSVDRSDSGKYLCSVVNYKGYAYRASYLTVVTSTEMNQLRDLGLPGINYCTLLIIVIAIIGCIVLVIFFTFFLYENRGRRREGILGLRIGIGRRGSERARIGGGGTKNASRIDVPGLNDGFDGKSHLFPTDTLSKTDHSLKFPISGHLYQPSVYHHHVKHLQPCSKHKNCIHFHCMIIKLLKIVTRSKYFLL